MEKALVGRDLYIQKFRYQKFECPVAMQTSGFFNEGIKNYFRNEKLKKKLAGK